MFPIKNGQNEEIWKIDCFCLLQQSYCDENPNTCRLLFIWTYFSQCVIGQISVLQSQKTWDGTSTSRTFEPAHEIMALFFLCKLTLQMRMHSHPVGLDVWFLVGPIIYLPYFMRANSEGSGETARMRRLVWAIAGRLCDKCNNLRSWLICDKANRTIIKYWIPETLEPC